MVRLYGGEFNATKKETWLPELISLSDPGHPEIPASHLAQIGNVGLIRNNNYQEFWTDHEVASQVQSSSRSLRRVFLFAIASLFLRSFASFLRYPVPVYPEILPLGFETFGSHWTRFTPCLQAWYVPVESPR